jgi:hypothetical protein
MKKLILSGLFVTAIALTALNFYNNANDNSLADIIAENVETHGAEKCRQAYTGCGLTCKMLGGVGDLCKKFIKGCEGCGVHTGSVIVEDAGTTPAPVVD